MEPFHKSKIVEYLQGMNENTNMTGDDVKKANIFSTMGSSTTVVYMKASDPIPKFKIPGV